MNRKRMATKTNKKSSIPLMIHGRNAAGKLIEGFIPAGKLPTEDPGAVIQAILARHKNIMPTPILL